MIDAERRKICRTRRVSYRWTSSDVSFQRTIRLIETELAKVPVTPRTTIVYVPSQVVPMVLIVSTAFPVPPDSSVIRLGLSLRVGLPALLGDIDIVRSTVPANSPMLVNVIVLLVAEPRVTFIWDGVAVTEKFGERGAGRLSECLSRYA